MPAYHSPPAFAELTLRLLDLEREAEVEAVREQLLTLPHAELEARGLVITGLRLADEETGMGGRTIVHLEHVHGGELPAHRFRSGDIVALRAGRGDAGARDAPTGVVHRVRRDRLTVVLDRDQDEPLPEALRLERVTNDITYQRMRDASQRLARYQRGPASRLIDLAFGARDPTPVVPAALTPLDPALDASQKEAVAFALASPDLALIHGPPGTGKTTALVELIRQEVRRGTRILACAPTNIAVDNLAERLAGAGVRIVRLGHPARLLPSIVEHALDRLIEEAEGTGVVLDVKKELERAQRRMRRARDRRDRDTIGDEMRALRREIQELERRTIHGILDGAEVILTTTTGAADSLLGAREFDLVVIDEAAQALEAASWIPLLRARRAVLAGDHHQLAPTIISKEAAAGGLALTLFDRMARAHEDALGRMLVVQYRMHETIMAWSSAEFYGGRLVADPSVRGHLLGGLDGVAEGDDTGIAALLIDTAGRDFDERDGPDGESKANEGEVGLVLSHLSSLIGAGVSPTDIAVIAPYNAQVSLLRERLHGAWPDLEIDSVDGFQGREKEAVILSLVRSNREGEVGFLADARRLNVAVTRARRHLCVIGDTATIAHDPVLARLVDHLQSRGTYRSAWEY